jgi:DNA-binding CsgD family transcriptional regulator
MTAAKTSRRHPHGISRSQGAEAKSNEPMAADTGAPGPELRKSGIRPIGDIPWGAHICMFYETAEDLLDAEIAYFEAGLANHEFCIWAVSEPIGKEDARRALRKGIPGFDRHFAAGSIEILDGRDWYLNGSEFDLQRITGGWHQKLQGALAKGYQGMRISGNAFWVTTNHWRAFCEYEDELNLSVAGHKMIVLCTYSLRASKAVDVLDMVRAHQFSLARRIGKWEFLETPELQRANRQIKLLSGALDVLSKPFSGHRSLTPKERVALAQIVAGASSKEAGQTLGISPRTVEFHRANIMRKLGAKNTVDLVRRVLGE